MATMPAPTSATGEQARQTPNRWLIALAAVVAHLCLGSVYAWSIFVEPIGSLTGWHKPQITWAFSTAIACLGLTAAFGAKFMQRLGPRRSVLLAGAFFAGGLLAAGLACMWHSLLLLYGGFGVIGGIGLGLGYAPPVATLLRWFPDKRGLATGMAVCGFGGGAMIASQIAEWLLPLIGCSGTFFALAAIYLPLIIVAALAMRLPPDDFVVRGRAAGNRLAEEVVIPVGVALRSSRFWLLWGVFYVNIAVGIMLIALAKPMAQSIGGLSEAGVKVVVPLLALFNAGGRLGWSSFSDYIGRGGAFLSMLVLQIVLFTLVPNVQGVLFVACLTLILSCYGGGFALVPAYIADLFGNRSTGPIYGAALTAWSAAAISGPPIGAYLVERTGSYWAAIYLACGLLLFGLIMAFVLHLLPDRQATVFRQSSHGSV